MSHVHNRAELLAHLSQGAIYLMGISFVLGSLCTIFILLILDMVRAARLEYLQAEAEHAPEEREQDQ